MGRSGRGDDRGMAGAETARVGGGMGLGGGEAEAVCFGNGAGTADAVRGNLLGALKGEGG